MHTLSHNALHIPHTIIQYTTLTHSHHTQFTESVIEAPSINRERFGMAIENIGDTDQDGIDGSHEGRGVVYMYRGSPPSLVANDFQVQYMLNDCMEC